MFCNIDGIDREDYIIVHLKVVPADNYTLDEVAALIAINTSLGSFLTKKQPLTAIIIALVLFSGLWISDIVLAGPENIYKGIVVRVIILYFLIKGIKHAREAERLRKEMASAGK